MTELFVFSKSGKPANRHNNMLLNVHSTITHGVYYYSRAMNNPEKLMLGQLEARRTPMPYQTQHIQGTSS